MKIILGITGASGAPYAMDFLRRSSADVCTLVSGWGEKLLAAEAEGAEEVRKLSAACFFNDQIDSPPASGSNIFDVMVVLPCTISTLAKIASGVADTLITRTAAVALKEQRRLVLCLRETPLSAISLESALKLSRLGVVIMPVSPPFYGSPESAGDLVRAFVDKVFRVIGTPEDAGPGWKSEELP
jgi:4-hydroxy-3-polyprenylbenzoate decarboxylase